MTAFMKSIIENPVPPYAKNKNPYQLNEDVEVRAWWFGGRVKLCRVIERSNPDHTNGEIYVTVVPLICSASARVPYGHSRWVNMTRDAVNPKEINEINNHNGLQERNLVEPEKQNQ